MVRIDTSKWKTYIIGNLFEVSRPKARKQIDYDSGKVPFVASGSFNNGVQAYLTPKNEGDIDRGKCITISPVDGYAFYQEENFLGRGGAGSSIIIIRNDNLNRYIGQYIASIIRHTFRSWSYSNMGTIDIVKEATINLPTKNENPDWQYMEEYMKSIERKTKEHLEKVQEIKKKQKIKIDFSTWEEFKISELGLELKKPCVYHAREVIEDEEGIPYVVRTKFNNGIKYRVKRPKECNPKGVISWGAENATFYYQNEEWCSGRDIYYIDTRKLSAFACRFLITCLMTIVSKYNYNDGLFPNLLIKEKIMLPIDKDGNHNWNYMDEFMKNLDVKCKKKVELLS